MKERGLKSVATGFIDSGRARRAQRTRALLMCGMDNIALGSVNGDGWNVLLAASKFKEVPCVKTCSYT